MDGLIIIRGYELLATSLFLAGLIWIIRERNLFYFGIYLGSSFAGVYFDWIQNLNWFFRIQFDERFIALYRIDGVPQPLAMTTSYAFYFGIPIIYLLHHSDTLKTRFGDKGQYIFVAFLGLLANLLIEIPLVKVFNLWTYYQKDFFLIGGVAWTTWFYSSMLFMFIYAGVLYSTKEFLNADDEEISKRKQIIVGYASVVTAFILVQFFQMMIYAFTNPWIESPRPF